MWPFRKRVVESEEAAEPGVEEERQLPQVEVKWRTIPSCPSCGQIILLASYVGEVYSASARLNALIWLPSCCTGCGLEFSPEKVSDRYPRIETVKGYYVVRQYAPWSLSRQFWCREEDLPSDAREALFELEVAEQRAVLRKKHGLDDPASSSTTPGQGGCERFGVDFANAGIL